MCVCAVYECVRRAWYQFAQAKTQRACKCVCGVCMYDHHTAVTIKLLAPLLCVCVCVWCTCRACMYLACGGIASAAAAIMCVRCVYV